ncbi:diaminobutyrate acetyltransferase [Krasilnikoviella flava]|uniref:L-2,4-diaminobutyric acid acetyltransferase n=1 Tax=Krasilnikoviella flava TaxID=526729 RepID=A0A1T5IC34_9MICO|nr:diaminobutyrate acetyltransferase [Krasilnikoviella flava]SKC36675.1 L-2,4-diaminobutyric acid acetyltransferase [Krasilnikoviella flava]
MDTTDPATTNHPTDDSSTGAPGTTASPRTAQPLAGLTVRPPTTADGAAMWRLARDSGSLDLNSSYAYLLLADHFAATCRLAFLGDGSAGDGAEGTPVGFLSAYRLPADPATLFVWQVAVDPRARGRRVAGRLLDAVVDAAADDGGPPVTRLHTTVTTDNTSSRRVFARWAAERGATLRETSGYEAAHFPDGHEAEPLLVIEGIRPPR